MSKHIVLLLLLTAAALLATSSIASSSVDVNFAAATAPVSSRSDASRGSKHFEIDARDVLADPRAAFASWSAYYSRPTIVAEGRSRSSSDDGSSKKKKKRSCHHNGEPSARGRASVIGSSSSSGGNGIVEEGQERARFDSWASIVLPRAQKALRDQKDTDRAPRIEINGIADLPLSTLRAGLSPARARQRGAERGANSNGFDDVVARAMEWVRFPYAAEAFYDALAQKSGRLSPGASSSSSSSSSSPPSSSSSEEEEEGTASSSSSSPSPFLFQRSSKSSLRRHRRRPIKPLPAAVDWSRLDVLGPVKNQHINNTPCGCCWSFATTGVVEGVVGVVASSGGRDKARIPPPSLSEQQLIDCDRGPPFDDLGCQGGSVEGGVNYIVSNHGRIDTEEDYPYTGVDDQGILACRRRKERKKSALDGSGARVVGFRDVPKKSESALKAAVARHPVAVAVCCGDFIDDWHAYTGGIMTFNGSITGCPKPLDHAVVVVGYGSGATDPSDPTGKRKVDYWIVKNSWGESWGENGYFKLARGLSSEEFPKGAAGLLSMPNFPVVEKVDDDDVDDDVDKDEE